MRPMKDSGVEWLSEVPQGWDVKPLWSISKAFAGGTPESSNPEYWDDAEGIPWIAIGDMSDVTRVLSTSKAVSMLGRTIKRLPLGEPGNVLFAMYASVGAAAILGIAATWNQAILGLRIDPLHAEEKYVFFLLKGISDVWNLLSNSNTQANLNQHSVMHLRIPLPSKSEQAEITGYLDQETSQIDTLISKKEQLIEKLLERRQALITQVVTKGLDPNVPMKDSGVEWLGELPQAWSLGKLSYYTSIKLGKMVQKDESVGGKFILYLSAISIQNEYLDDATDKKMWASPIDFTSLSLLRNDLLVVEGGMAGMTAHLAADFPNVIFQNSLNRVRVHQEMMVSRFVFYWLNSLRYRGLIESICNKATIMHLTREKLASLPIVCPPRQKQIGIVEYLDQETSQIDTLVEKTRRAIELLKERRQALITQVVTGKIDVRGSAGGNS